MHLVVPLFIWTSRYVAAIVQALSLIMLFAVYGDCMQNDFAVRASCIWEVHIIVGSCW